MTTTKRDLAKHVAKETGCRQSLVAEMVDSIFAAMRESLMDGERIEIRGFGVFEVRNTRPKPAARNPRTGDIIQVPARRKTHFKPGKILKEELRKPRSE
jgi:nucleoid DNA-binding protein